MSHLQTNVETHRKVEEHTEIQRLISSFHHQYHYRELGTRNGSPAEVAWYSGGNSERVSLTIGLG